MSDLSDIPTPRKRSMGQFFAAASVVLSLLFVGWEIRQNTALARAQTRNELSISLVELLSESAGNSQLMSILRRANDGENLTLDETSQFRERQAAMFRYWENVHYQYRRGLYEESEFSRQREAWRRYVNQSAAVAQAWCGIRDVMAIEFAAEVDGLLENYRC
jgi:hypothetical protein